MDEYTFVLESFCHPISLSIKNCIIIIITACERTDLLFSRYIDRHFLYSSQGGKLKCLTVLCVVESEVLFGFTFLGAAASIILQFVSISTATLNTSAAWQVSAVLHTAAVSIGTLPHLCTQQVLQINKCKCVYVHMNMYVCM